ncbi:MAG: helix-turn-helix domain-containing protein [Bacteroidota bacterium]
MIDNEVLLRIAQKIRTTRLKKNLTIQQLAARSKVSKGLLSKIENSRTVPSLPVFVTLIQSLNITMKEFFEDMVFLKGKEYLLVKKDQYTPMEREGRAGFNYTYILSQTITAQTMEAVLLALEPGAKGRPSTAEGYEFKYVISGSCEYHINNDIVILEEGDSLFFDASLPHLPVNRSRKHVTMLVFYFILSKNQSLLQ